MKALILFGAAALLGFAVLHSAAPASPPIVPIHAPSPEAASGTLPTAARSAKSTHAPLVVGSVTSPTFRGYACTVDCSGHEAGYEWAEENDIDDPDDCGGKSESFIEGCRAYAEEQGADAADEDADDNDEGAGGEDAE